MVIKRGCPNDRSSTSKSKIEHKKSKILTKPFRLVISGEVYSGQIGNRNIKNEISTFKVVKCCVSVLETKLLSTTEIF